MGDTIAITLTTEEVTVIGNALDGGYTDWVEWVKDWDVAESHIEELQQHLLEMPDHNFGLDTLLTLIQEQLDGTEKAIDTLEEIDLMEELNERFSENPNDCLLTENHKDTVEALLGEENWSDFVKYWEQYFEVADGLDPPSGPTTVGYFFIVFCITLLVLCVAGMV